MKLFLLFLAAVFLSTAGADVVYRNPEPVEIARLVETDGYTSTIEFNLQALVAEEEYLPEFGNGYIFRALPECGLLAEIGSPNLPVYRRMVQVPASGNITVEVISEETSVLGLYNVLPYQPSPVWSLSAPPPYKINDETYSTSEYFPGPVVKIESVNILRDIRVAWLCFQPVRVNPVTGEVIVTTSLTVRVETGSEIGENELLRVSSGSSRSFHQLYENVLGYQDNENLIDGSYVFISTADGLALVEDLINWKRQMGFEVHTGIIPDIGSTSSEIDAWIEDAYSTWPNPPEWILLVGSELVVPTPFYNGHAADNIYGVIGSGSVPSIHVGRLTGGDTDAITYMAWKIYQHEMNPYQPDPSWFQNAISLACNSGGAPQAPPFGLRFANFFREDDMDVNWLCDELGGEPPTVANFTAYINDGRSVISYIGHGNIDVFSTPGFYNSDIAGLTNGRELPWVYTIGCENGHFNGHYCIAEAWMAEGSIAEPKGAVAVMASSASTPMGEGDSLMIYTLKGYFVEDYWSMGECYTFGKTKVHEFYPGSSGDNMNHMATIFGDPAMDIYNDTSPIYVLDVTHASTISTGSYDVTVYCEGSPVEGAMVGLVQVNDLLDGAYSNASGIATLDITSFPGGLTEVDVTVTSHNCSPYFGTTQPTTGIGDESGGCASALFLGAVPNPMSASAAITYSTISGGPVKLEVFDMSGRLVSNLTDSEVESGYHTVQWNGKDESGISVPDGVYFYRLTTIDGSLVKSCIVLR